jgi:hypothetical protein
MTRRISAVAVCCASASARRFSSSRRLETSFFSDFRAAASSGSTFDLAGFVRFASRIGLSLAVAGITTAQRSTTG